MTRRFWAHDGGDWHEKIICRLCRAAACGNHERLRHKKRSYRYELPHCRHGRHRVRAVVCEDRVYVPFCVVSKSGCGEQIGYVDGDEDDRISEYKGYPAEEWLVSWIQTDGGAMLMKEESVTEIPDGLEAEYQ